MRPGILLCFCLIFFWPFGGMAQNIPLNYYLPDINYNKDIPTPEEFFGFQIGEWHISHDQLVAYMKKLAELSPRVQIKEYARTYEQRPLLYLTITSEENFRDLDEIKVRHQQLSNPETAASIDVAKQPVVIYQGYSVHGNEASGGNAAPLVAYYLAAGKDREVDKLLDDAIILLDPCYNPDGFHRFSTWTNMHKSNAITTDPNDREYNEVWPGGRTNHYWFDLNRDWLPLQHPASKGRIDVFQDWQPVVLTDHHEMSTNATFFFQPGVPERLNPLTPMKNQELTAKIGEYHALALETIGSLYFTEERYDDFYYGKGSTYPDVNGSIGILFEQASSRGKAQESVNGEIDFAFTIRNQVVTSFSTQQAALEMREELLNYRRQFYQDAMQEALSYPRKAFVFTEEDDPARLNHFVDILLRHKIKVHQLASSTSIGGVDFSANRSYVVPLEQPQHRLIRAIFEESTTFNDSLFYDVSAWTLPLAFNLQSVGVDRSTFTSNMLGEALEATPIHNGLIPDYSEYAYLMEWEDYYAPKALYRLLEAGIRVKVTTMPFRAKEQVFERGTLMIPVQNQNMDADELFQYMQLVAREAKARIHDIDSGLTPEGPDLGSSEMETLEKPEILLLAGEGVSGYDAGENWFMLDQRFEIPVTLMEPADVARRDLSRYNVLLMPNGSYYTLNSSAVGKIREWVQNGGTLIAMRSACEWVARNKIGYVELVEEPQTQVLSGGRRPYSLVDPDNGKNVIGGAIFDTRLDLTHPLAYGYSRAELPVFRKGTTFLKVARNPYATPLMYTDEPLLSGYISSKNSQMLASSAAVVVTGTGSGRVICMADNPNFRAFWYGTSKLYSNAIFFSSLISSRALERAPVADE